MSRFVQSSLRWGHTTPYIVLVRHLLLANILHSCLLSHFYLHPMATLHGTVLIDGHYGNVKVTMSRDEGLKDTHVCNAVLKRNG